jgi:hypothetical protein
MDPGITPYQSTSHTNSRLSPAHFHYLTPPCHQRYHIRQCSLHAQVLDCSSLGHYVAHTLQQGAVLEDRSLGEH